MYAERRLKLVEEQIFSLLPEWTLRPVVDALQVMRGIALINSVVLREAGWLRLLACLGLAGEPLLDLAGFASFLAVTACHRVVRYREIPLPVLSCFGLPFYGYAQAVDR
jgi:hypothetical protein